MNKTELLQVIELLNESCDFLGVEETPMYDEVEFMPIASDRFAHADAALALATDVAAEGAAQTTEPTPVAPGVTAD